MRKFNLVKSLAVALTLSAGNVAMADDSLSLMDISGEDLHLAWKAVLALMAAPVMH